MSNSSLVSYTRLSPNKSKRTHAIDTITPHCMAGDLSVESCGNVFANPSRQASSNYGIGSDGRKALYVEEAYRSWCSSNQANDDRAITIEIANDGGSPDWHISDKAMASLIELCVDICKRNNIPKLVWSTDKNTRVKHLNGANMTVHRDFTSKKACPGDYIYNHLGYVADEVNKRLYENITNNTTYDGLDYAPVFDFGYYYGKYEDLRNAFGSNKEALFNHFINYGMKEGRQANSDFNVAIYRDNYADLRNAFKDDLPSYYRHYCTWGKNEKRIANTNINSKPSSAISIKNPVTKYGNRDYADVYDYNYYINKYADLRMAFEFDDVATLQHFITYGMKEGRQAKSDFNVINYKNRYADLRQAFGDDLSSYYLHYIIYGKKEGRNAK